MGIEIAVMAAVGSGLLDVMQKQEQAEADQDFLQSQEAMARQQAEEEVQRSNRIAESEEIQATETARRGRLKDKKALARQRAFQATSGVSQTEGSPLMIDEQNQITSMFNMNDIFNAGLTRGSEIRYQGKQAERGLLFEADQYKYQRKMSKKKAKSQMITGLFNAAAGGVGAAKGMKAGAGSGSGFSGISASSGGAPSFKGFSASPTGTKGF
tara:strand:- start:169 stop:804 length:636 start_codon:yes stop_codon:yes gene_type:complete